MQIRRRCRRYCLGRLIIYFLLLIATSSTIIFSYNFYSNIFLSENSERHKIYYIDESDLEEARIKPTENVRFLREDFFNTSKIMCRYPKLAIDNPEVWKHLNPVKQSRPDCEKSTNWVYVENGLFSKEMRSEEFVMIVVVVVFSRNISIISTGFTKTWTNCLCLSAYSSIER